jgi:type IV secretion system protein TrbF
MESDFYLQARREWDERYGDLVLGKRNWQITSAGLMLLSLILALGIVWMSARTKVIRFVVEVGLHPNFPPVISRVRRLFRTS